MKFTFTDGDLAPGKRSTEGPEEGLIAQESIQNGIRDSRMTHPYLAQTSRLSHA